MTDYVRALRERLATVDDLHRAHAVLIWDQQTYMPRGGAQARADQASTLAQLAHEQLLAPEVGQLLAAAEEEVRDLPADSIDRNLVRVAKRDYDQATRIPAALIAEISRHDAIAHPVWVDAREHDDYAAFAPYLQRTFELSRELAEHLGYEDEPYDALLDQYEPGVKTAHIRRLFSDLRNELAPLVASIWERTNTVDDAVLRQPFDERAQEDFGVMVIRRFGYDFDRGRQDRTVHPFEIPFSRGDVRITTRFDPNYLSDGLFSTLHESGHAMYEQGISTELERTPLASGASSGVHESQSRLWENLVGRSRLFWERFYPDLQQAFPHLAGVSLDAFYGAINKVQPSLIRVDADEVTYNLHVLLRFQMELGLLDGSISVHDAPAIWNQKMEAYLGIRPPNNTLGILQDVHWSGASTGYFPTYALGNILSCQLFDAATRAKPGIPDEIARGEFGALRGWLTENVYQYGRIFDPADLIERATGEPPTIEPYVRYLKRKFGELYGLPNSSLA